MSDRRMRKRRRRTFTWIAIIPVVSLAVGLALAHLLPTQREFPADGIVNRQIAGIATSAVALVIVTVGFIWGIRTRHFIPRWKQVASPLTLAERQWVMKQVRGKAETDEEFLDVVLAIAHQIRQTTLGASPFFLGLALIAVGTALTTDQILVYIIEFLALLLFVVGGILLARDYRLAGKFIERYE